MAVETVYSRKLRAMLDNGTTTSGTVKTLTQSLGELNKDAWDVDKAYAIGALLSPCLTKSIYRLEDVATYSITSGS